ncbi:hypothetical protein ACOBR2_08265 [Telmatobacter bradus]|uniref:hypothetical protein n=1 Tax=Telmatobacter bradus TaxID=474953 RepID=UPI003B42B8C7
MLKKLLTKPVWYWERKREYPIRQRYTELPPIAVTPSSARLVVLTTPAALPDALWAAWSWYRFLKNNKFQLQFVVDGKLSAQTEADAKRLFPEVRIDEAAQLVEKLGQEEPVLGGFFRDHPLGKKLGFLLALSQQSPLLYSDHDVLAFHPPVELLDCIARNEPCFFLEDKDDTRDAEIVKRAQTLGANYLPNFNSGVLYIPQGALSVALAVDLLRDWKPPVRSWFTEQTILSILMQAAQARPLPESRYIISNHRQFYWQQDVDYRKISARHFTGPVRHVLYKFGMPFLLEQSKKQETATV